MCGRYTLVLDRDSLSSFDIDPPNNYSYRSYNICPSQSAPIISLNKGNQKCFSLMEWGLLPHWVQDKTNIHRPINARIETAYEKPMFRNSVKERRCLVPASGFYEWSPLKKPKQPYYFFQDAHVVMAFAGLWDLWNKEDQIVLSYAILTKPAEQAITPVHDRMPIILSPKDYNGWLFKNQLPETGPLVENYPVGLMVNSPIYNLPSLIEKSKEC